MEDVEDLDEEVVKDLFKGEGYMHKEQGEEVRIIWFEGIECEQALYLFTKENSFRRACFLLYQNAWFERIILFLIVTSSLKLAIDTYGFLYPPDHDFNIISGHLDQFFTWAFIVEAFLKIISMGFIMDEGSYLRDMWNQLDGLIVFNSIVEMILEA